MDGRRGFLISQKETKRQKIQPNRWGYIQNLLILHWITQKICVVSGNSSEIIILCSCFRSELSDE